MNKRLETAFNKYIDDLNKPKTYNTYQGSYGGGGYNGGYRCGAYGGSGQLNSPPPYNAYTDCTIFFYEYTNLRSGAKHFKTKTDFFKFLNECKITYTEAQKKQIEEAKYKNIFATCVPNKPELMTADTWYLLNQAITHLTCEKSSVTNI